MSTLVIGLGSPFLRDDGIGLQVVRELTRHQLPGVRLIEVHAGGLALVEEMHGSERVVIVDASLNPYLRPGEIAVTGVGSTTCHAACSHDCTLEQALALARSVGLPVPPDERITIVAVGVADIGSFDDRLSPSVAAVLPQICAAVADLATTGAGL